MPLPAAPIAQMLARPARDPTSVAPQRVAEAARDRLDGVRSRAPPGSRGGGGAANPSSCTLDPLGGFG